jgi:hypothetical protein
MKKRTIVLIWIVFQILAVIVLYYVSNGISDNFAEHVTVRNYKGKIYHIIPEEKLSSMLILIDKKGNKHYVVSEEQLRLLGPKLLTGEVE